MPLLCCCSLSSIFEAPLFLLCWCSLLIWCRRRSVQWALCHLMPPFPHPRKSPSVRYSVKPVSRDCYHYWLYSLSETELAQPEAKWRHCSWNLRGFRPWGSLYTNHFCAARQEYRVSKQCSALPPLWQGLQCVHTQLLVLWEGSSTQAETGQGHSGKYNWIQTHPPHIWATSPHILLLSLSTSVIGLNLVTVLSKRSQAGYLTTSGRPLWIVPSRHYLLCLFTALSPRTQLNSFLANNFSALLMTEK